ncbi:MAG: hypothetical protein PHH54_04870 [Candidatus Nanoarchaeia archaeon]|nr:hypothetical protein [Candidatus Nanoarchaeia archaeon]MDD5741290.1 hypothetical protein [Candidatus Nanoarchaeia archaeon]
MEKGILFGLGFFLFIFLISVLAAGDYFGETSSTVFIKEGIFCPSEYNHTKWVDTITNNSYATVGADPVFDCRDFGSGYDFVGEGACCPKTGSTFNTCQLITGQLSESVQLLPNVIDDDKYKCLISNVTSCSSYGEDECENYVPDVAIESIESSSVYGEGWCNKAVDKPWEVGIKICSNFTSCSCVWNATEEKCLADASKIKDCNDRDNYTFGFCQYAITVDDSQCTQPNGMIIWNWTVINPHEDMNCAVDPETKPCTDITKLNFFTWINVIAVIVILVVTYYLYLISKKKRKKKKQR